MNTEEHAEMRALEEKAKRMFIKDDTWITIINMLENDDIERYNYLMRKDNSRSNIYINYMDYSGLCENCGRFFNEGFPKCTCEVIR